MPYFSGRVSAVVLDGFLKGRPAQPVPLGAERLTSREREIVQLLAEGNSNKAIATRLDLSVKTVETHRASVMRKLDLNSLADIVRFAVRNHIIQPEIRSRFKPASGPVPPSRCPWRRRSVGGHWAAGNTRASPVVERNRLLGAHGDAINAILAATGHNLRLLVAWLRALCALLWAALRLGAPPRRANSSHDPPFDLCILPNSIQVIPHAKDVSHPDDAVRGQ